MASLSTYWRPPWAPLGTRRLPYRSFFDRDGVEIRVGRSGKDNDDLSFRHSRGNDVWLHVRGRPGAHVVIVRPGPAPSPELLVRAAQLALKYSGLAPGARILDSGSWIRDPGSGIQDPGPWLHVTFLDPGSRILDPGS